MKSGPTCFKCPAGRASFRVNSPIYEGAELELNDPAYAGVGRGMEAVGKPFKSSAQKANCSIAYGR